MTTELLEINLNKETNFDFELSITGISANSARVRFGIELPAFTLQIPCVRGNDKTWSVTIPKLEDFVEEGQYTFTIELVVDGYYFAPVKGAAKIAPVAEVIGSVPRKSVEVAVTSITPKKPIVRGEEDEKDEETPKKILNSKNKKKSAEKKQTKKSVKEESAEESVVDKMVNRRFKPFEKGKSILSQMTDLTNEKQEKEPLTEQQMKVRNILKNIRHTKK